GHLFADDAGKSDAKEENIAKATASIGAVSGADILQAIVQSKDNPVSDSTDGIEKAKDAAGIAIAPVVGNKKELKRLRPRKMLLLQRVLL
ncbi:Variable outer membrane protein, partial [Borrelia duttonii CR2A]